MVKAPGRRWLAGRWALGVLAVFVTLYVGAAAFLWTQQRTFLFPADSARVSLTAAALNGFEEVTLVTPDGERLVAWWRPPPAGAGAVIYFHGNGGSIADRAGRLRDIADAGLGVLGVSYRGYGGSTGSPSEAGLIVDAAPLRTGSPTGSPLSGQRSSGRASGPVSPWLWRPSARSEAWRWTAPMPRWSACKGGRPPGSR